jgi:hypothetical protein
MEKLILPVFGAKGCGKSIRIIVLLMVYFMALPLASRTYWIL